METKYLPALLLLFCILLTPKMDAQTIRFDHENFAFFQRKADAYQRWLDATGLGKALQITKVRPKKDSTELELLLRVNSTDLDTAIALWNRAKDDYKLSTGQPLEENSSKPLFPSWKYRPNKATCRFMCSMRMTRTYPVSM